MSRLDPKARPPCRSLMGVRILGTGSYVPDGVINNDHIYHRFGYPPRWIVRQTGICERRHVVAGQATTDLAFEASRRCLEQAKIHPHDIDLLLVATVTPDMTFPSSACLLQDRLGLRCGAADLGAACAGFTYALVTAAAYVVSGASDCALVVGADCLSRVINPEDKKVLPLFGDGAGAVVIAKGQAEQGIIAYSLGADGRGGHFIQRRGGGSRMPPSPEMLAEGAHYLEMAGTDVFNWAASILSDSIGDVLKAANLAPNDVDLYVPHQANLRIINAAIDVLGIDRQRVFTNIDRYGNTSAASVPLALDEAVTEGRVQAGQRVVLSGFGAGLAWGTLLVQW